MQYEVIQRQTFLPQTTKIRTGCCIDLTTFVLSCECERAQRGSTGQCHSMRRPADDYWLTFEPKTVTWEYAKYTTETSFVGKDFHIDSLGGGDVRPWSPFTGFCRASAKLFSSMKMTAAGMWYKVYTDCASSSPNRISNQHTTHYGKHLRLLQGYHNRLSPCLLPHHTQKSPHTSSQLAYTAFTIPPRFVITADILSIPLAQTLP
jgi:hypothetical protein